MGDQVLNGTEMTLTERFAADLGCTPSDVLRHVHMRLFALRLARYKDPEGYSQEMLDSWRSRLTPTKELSP